MTSSRDGDPGSVFPLGDSYVARPSIGPHPLLANSLSSAPEDPLVEVTHWSASISDIKVPGGVLPGIELRIYSLHRRSQVPAQESRLHLEGTIEITYVVVPEEG